MLAEIVGSSFTLPCCDLKPFSRVISPCIARNGGHFTPVINCRRHLIFKIADKTIALRENVHPTIFYSQRASRVNAQLQKFIKYFIHRFDFSIMK